ncbi:TonB-linked outer membrane protein, SusC/RagA family [Fodinibius roseus]|uniref:TonB-linked outer membrane protein, SusC/RagA family n=1 Tax=Fodinibius roseus TaxID=1194090 RepID=A0A1M4W8S6_9BACT|nr:TonB-dependent receptor [Fodinibius roseus]SHE77560.1 TonB-linked outer membrane protein, SusC/RagA family [Fodinibius roseus]
MGITYRQSSGKLNGVGFIWFCLLLSCSVSVAWAQNSNHLVRGTVTAAEDAGSLPGVNVMVKGTTIGASTDSKGRFEVYAPSIRDTLVFSFIGYQTREVAINGRSVLDVALRSRAISGEEVVVIGYGEQKKSTLTESASAIDGEEIAARPTANLSQSLQGTLPGLNITQSSGDPASAPNINIRGFTSINGGNPLVLIDGVEGDINEINPKDVESVTVLKDASASAIYGARAAFGVVLVTTKSPRSGRAQVSYSNNFGWQTTTTNTDFVTDPYRAARLVDESFRVTTGNSYTGYTEEDYEQLQRRSGDPSLPDVVVDNRNGREQYIYYGNTDWWNTMFRRFHPTQTHDLSISGGSDRLSVSLSGRMYRNAGILKVQDDTYDSYNGRAKIDYQVNDWLRLSDNIHLNSSEQVRHGGSMYGWGEPWGSLIWVHALPSYVPRNPDGTATFRTELNNYTIGDGVFASLLYGKSKQIINNRELGNTIEATVTPADNVEIVTDYTTRVEYYRESRRNTRVPWSVHPGEIEYLGNDQLREYRNEDTYTAFNIYAKYAHETGDHSFEETIGLNNEQAKYESVQARKRNSISDDLNALDLGTGASEAYGSAREWAVLGYFFRLNYNFDERYLLEVNGRYDATSRFPEEHRWGFFPSVSAGWMISNEDFFSGLTGAVSQLKIRGSYGSLGNQQVATYAYTPTLNKGTADYLINDSKLEYIDPPELNPRDITWEEVNTINMGMDLGLWSSKLTASVDLYQRSTLGMLTQGRTLPAVLGTSSPEENAADLRTRGFEVQLGYQNTFDVGGQPLNLALKAALSNQKTTITDFDNPNDYLGDYYEGQTIGEIWGYHIDGLFRSEEEIAGHADQTRVNSSINSSPGEYGQLLPGDVKYADLNGDGVIDEGDNTLENPGDRRVIGNATPQFPYSFSVQTEWNNIDLSLFLQGIGKQDWYPDNDSRIFWAMYNRPYDSFQRKDLVNNIWSPENPDAYFPRLRGYTALGSSRQLGAVNDRYLQSVAYLRLKNLTVGYTLPRAWTAGIGSRVRFYFSGENLLTFSKLTDYIDPEAASNGITFSQAEERYGEGSTAQTYPFSKVYSFGINLDF